MNSDVNTYNLNEPMTWKMFKKMPGDLKCDYIRAIEQRFNAPRNEVAKMLGVTYNTLRKELTGLGFAHSHRGKSKWNEAAFEEWCNGTKGVKMPTEEIVPCAEPAEEENCENTSLQTPGELNWRFEYFRVCEELEKAKYEICQMRDIVAEHRRICAEMDTIKRTMYVIFGRSFDNE